MAENTGRELGWDDQIENDGQDFIVLAAGEYDFEVVEFERARYGGSDKLPPCNQAIVHIKISSLAGSTTIKHNLYLHSVTEGLLCAFFTAIGQRKKGEKLVMNWPAVVGSKGRCKVSIRNYKDKNSGDDRQINQIDKFLEPDGSKAGATYQTGRF